MLAQIGHQCLLRLSLLGDDPGPARFGGHAAALEAFAEAGQLLLHGAFDARMQRLAMAGQPCQRGFRHRLQRTGNGSGTGLGAFAQRLLQRYRQSFLQCLAVG